MTRNYDKYLEELHKKNQTPDEIIREVVREATGKEITEKQRVVAGEVNEVYEITLTNNVQVFLRISRKDKPEFFQEKWAIDQCKKVGVPVPEVLLIKHLSHGGQLLSFCVQRKLEGQVLERGLVNRHSLDKNHLRKLINHAGEILSKIHSVKTNGFGSLDKKGNGEFKSFTDLIHLNHTQQETYLQLAKQTGFSQVNMKQIINIVNENSYGLNGVSAFLSHGDYCPKHFTFEGDRITGILDWGDVSGNSPLYDIVRWNYWYDDDIPTAWLIEGYPDKMVLNNYQEVLPWFKLSQGLETFYSYSKNNYSDGVEFAKKKLLADLSFFEKQTDKTKYSPNTDS